MEESNKQQAIEFFINSRLEQFTSCDNEQLIGLARLVDCYLYAKPCNKKILASMAKSAKKDFLPSRLFSHGHDQKS